MLLVIIIYFFNQSLLSEFYYISFIYPAEAAANIVISNRWRILLKGWRFFVLNFAPLIFFLAAGAAIFLLTNKEKGLSRKIIDRVRKMQFLTLGLISWLVVGFLLILVQRLSWWDYHYFLLFVPLGILALKSIEFVWIFLTENTDFFGRNSGRAILITILLLMLLVFPYQAGTKIFPAFFNSGASTIETAPARFGDTMNQYKAIQKRVSLMSEPESRSGKIFVCGQPLYYYLSKRSPAIATNGWMPEFFLPKQWERLDAEIIEKKPVFIVVDRSCQDIISEKHSQTTMTIDTFYQLHHADKDVSFYKLKEAR